MDEKMSGVSGWGLVIFLILLFTFFTGGGGSFFGRTANAAPAWEAEKQEIIDSARTQYLVENTARQTQEQTAAGLVAIGNKIDAYQYQDLRDQLQQARAENMALKSQVYTDNRFNAIEIALQQLGCKMLTKPDVTGVGVVSPNAGIINGLGINSLAALGGYCNN